MFDFEGRTLTRERAQLYIDKGYWTEESFVDVFYNDVKQYPNFVHRDEEREASYEQLWNEIEAVAATLYEMGVRKGDTVALQLPNALDYVVGVFAAARIGAIGVSLQIDLGRQALLTSLQTSRAKVWIIADYFRGQPLYDMAVSLKAELPDLKEIVLQGDPQRAPEGALTFASLRDSGKKLGDTELAANRPGALDAFLMVFTSGTTGSPKGVVHYHANYLWAARAYAKNFGYEPGEGVLCLAPICHQTGMLAGVMMTVAKGGRIMLLERFSAARVLKWIEEYRPTYLVGAPPHVIHVANAPNLKATDTSSVKLFIYAGAPVPSAVLVQLQADSGIKVGCMFGWSEGFLATATRPDDPLEALSSTVGFAIPGTEVRLVDEDGHDVKPGEPGEMWSRGPNFSAGYYQNPTAAHKQWDADGWFHSGDVLRQDENGRYVFIARADDIINRGGTKIDPKTVEDAISKHPSVENVAVVGAPDATLGQHTVACVILREGHAALSLKELREFLAEQGLAKFQFPDRLELMTEFPQTHSGKIKKKDLRERFRLEAEGQANGR
ncbi:cyclohexanecarboxylate-CoA ligase/acyl-CoA synthetase [Alicyclobacillus sacchari]|uniref:Cyclohexanecarboxylate-CoA ligase/acyl-CoA synthetase n=1 Tax=Alicyclobacillus sacchari TaxID=392010 RepID=A0A4R8LUA6_9BACL|nr:AMP-binding protein [Alicyclobacillus sacchari]TDY51339.1 cyclohexanecarboxylate-CoA ligase/acyl-CoA synthetase [Alicyclobacillus sacchari]GMA56647.1 AMP-binding protein [Alicyclobacillus sacchari]